MEATFHAMNFLVCGSRLLLHTLLHAATTHPSSPVATALSARQGRKSYPHKEHHWTIPIYMHAAVFAAAHYSIGFVSEPVPYARVPEQLLCGVVAHNLLTEPLYYLLHRWLHVPRVFRRLHSYHHEFRYTDPLTGLVQDNLEHVLYAAVFGLYMVLATVCGYHLSPWYVGAHMLVFDACNALGHVDVEWWPRWYVRSPLRFVFYTPSYHAVHHREYGHFCLFSPVWDWVGGTYRDAAYRAMFERLHLDATPSPDATVLFLGHHLGPTSALHVPWVSRVRRNQRIRLEGDSACATVAGYVLCRLNRLACRWTVSGACPTNVCTYELATASGATRTARVVTATLPRDLHEYRASDRDAVNAAIERVARAWRPDHLVLGANNKLRAINNQCADLQLGHATVASHGNTNTAIWCAGSLLRVWPYLEQAYGRAPCVLVTGASSSIGLVLATLLVEKGCRVHFATSDAGRYRQFAKTVSAASVVRVDPRDATAFHAVLRRCDIWCVGVIPSMHELRLVRHTATIANFSAVELPPASTPRILEIASMQLAGGGPLRHTSRFYHGLSEGRLHSCMIGGILRALDGATGHEDPVPPPRDVLAVVDARMAQLGALGFVAATPNHPFCADGCSRITEHLRMLARWYPFDHVDIEIHTECRGLYMFDHPQQIGLVEETLDQLVGVDHPVAWELNETTLQLFPDRG